MPKVKGMPAPTDKLKQLTVKISPATYKLVKVYCAQNEVPMSALHENALQTYLRIQAKKAAK